ncbi:hypothetical protein ACFL4L_02355 [bacterium]
MNRTIFNKHFSIVIVFLIFIVNTSAQVSEEQARANLQLLFSAHDNLSFYENEDIEQIRIDLKNNPEPYLSVISEDLVLPENMEILAEEDSLNYYYGLIGTLFYIDNDEAKTFIYDQYYQQKNLLNSINNEINSSQFNSLSDEEKDKLIYAQSNVASFQCTMIKNFISYDYSQMIPDCIGRIEDENYVIQINIINYFQAMAVEDTMIISKMIGLYKDTNSSLNNDPYLKKVLSDMGVQIEIDPNEVISNLIEYINTQSDEGNIDNPGIANSLIAKLETAQKQLKDEKPKQAVNALNAFLNELDAQQGKHISDEVYRYLKEKVEGLVLQIE